MTKVLLVGPYPPPHGGISVHVAAAQALLVRHGVSCAVIDPGRPPGLASALSRIRRLAVEGHTLHVHANGHNTRSWVMALSCAIAARRAPGRVITLHSGMLPEFLRASSSARQIARNTLSFQDRIVCVSGAVREAVAALGVPADRLVTMPAYLPLPEQLPAPPESATLWLTAHHPVLCATLSFRPEYGLDLLLEGVRRLRHRHARLGCVLLGGGEGAEQAQARIRELGLEGSVLLLGDVPHTACLSIISRATVFVRPTERDGDAISVREALALGLPVVASDAARRPEGVVIHRSGDAAHLVAAVEEALAKEPLPPRSWAEEGRAALEMLLRCYPGAASVTSIAPLPAGAELSRGRTEGEPCFQES